MVVVGSLQRAGSLQQMVAVGNLLQMVDRRLLINNSNKERQKKSLLLGVL
jgi:hypothetical protein